MSEKLFNFLDFTNNNESPSSFLFVSLIIHSLVFILIIIINNNPVEEASEPIEISFVTSQTQATSEAIDLPKIKSQALLFPDSELKKVGVDNYSQKAPSHENLIKGPKAKPSQVTPEPPSPSTGLKKDEMAKKTKKSFKGLAKERRSIYQQSPSISGYRRSHPSPPKTLKKAPHKPSDIEIAPIQTHVNSQLALAKPNSPNQNQKNAPLTKGSLKKTSLTSLKKSLRFKENKTGSLINKSKAAPTHQDNNNVIQNTEAIFVGDQLILEEQVPTNLAPESIDSFHIVEGPGESQAFIDKKEHQKGSFTPDLPGDYKIAAMSGSKVVGLLQFAALGDRGHLESTPNDPAQPFDTLNSPLEPSDPTEESTEEQAQVFAVTEHTHYVNVCSNTFLSLDGSNSGVSSLSNTPLQFSWEVTGNPDGTIAKLVEENSPVAYLKMEVDPNVALDPNLYKSAMANNIVKVRLTVSSFDKNNNPISDFVDISIQRGTRRDIIGGYIDLDEETRPHKDELIEKVGSFTVGVELSEAHSQKVIARKPIDPLKFLNSDLANPILVVFKINELEKIQEDTEYNFLT